MRAVALLQILVDVVANHATLYMPDSDCRITRLLVRLLSLLRQQSQVYLLPDGYITTKPLSLRPDNIILHRPVSAEDVIRDLTRKRHRSHSPQPPDPPVILVSLKRPTGMPLSVSIHVARAMLADAFNEVRLRHRDERPFSTEDHHHPPQPSLIHVIRHRTFPLPPLGRLISEVARRCSESGVAMVKFKSVDYREIALENVASLYSLPSTVIWELWQLNSTALLHLYDPTAAAGPTRDAWVRELSSALATSRSTARSKSGRLIRGERRQDGLLVETWTRSPAEPSGPGHRS